MTGWTDTDATRPSDVNGARSTRSWRARAQLVAGKGAPTASSAAAVVLLPHHPKWLEAAHQRYRRVRSTFESYRASPQRRRSLIRSLLLLTILLLFTAWEWPVWHRLLDMVDMTRHYEVLQLDPASIAAAAVAEDDAGGKASPRRAGKGKTPSGGQASDETTIGEDNDAEGPSSGHGRQRGSGGGGGTTTTTTLTAAMVKKAYRKKVREWHPDTHPGCGQRCLDMMRKVQEAYDVLLERGTDESRRGALKESYRQALDQIVSLTYGRLSSMVFASAASYRGTFFPAAIQALNAISRRLPLALGGGSSLSRGAARHCSIAMELGYVAAVFALCLVYIATLWHPVPLMICFGTVVVHTEAVFRAHRGGGGGGSSRSSNADDGDDSSGIGQQVLGGGATHRSRADRWVPLLVFAGTATASYCLWNGSILVRTGVTPKFLFHLLLGVALIAAALIPSRASTLIDNVYPMRCFSVPSGLQTTLVQPPDAQSGGRFVVRRLVTWRSLAVHVLGILADDFFCFACGLPAPFRVAALLVHATVLLESSVLPWNQQPSSSNRRRGTSDNAVVADGDAEDDDEAATAAAMLSSDGARQAGLGGWGPGRVMRSYFRELLVDVAEPASQEEAPPRVVGLVCMRLRLSSPTAAALYLASRRSATASGFDEVRKDGDASTAATTPATTATTLRCRLLALDRLQFHFAHDDGTLPDDDVGVEAAATVGDGNDEDDDDDDDSGERAHHHEGSAAQQGRGGPWQTPLLAPGDPNVAALVAQLDSEGVAWAQLVGPHCRDVTVTLPPLPGATPSAGGGVPPPRTTIQIDRITRPALRALVLAEVPMGANDGGDVVKKPPGFANIANHANCMSVVGAASRLLRGQRAAVGGTAALNALSPAFAAPLTPTSFTAPRLAHWRPVLLALTACASSTILFAVIAVAALTSPMVPTAFSPSVAAAAQRASPQFNPNPSAGGIFPLQALVNAELALGFVVGGGNNDPPAEHRSGRGAKKKQSPPSAVVAIMLTHDVADVLARVRVKNFLLNPPLVNNNRGGAATRRSGEGSAHDSAPRRRNKDQRKRS